VNSSAVPESKVYPNPNQISNQSPFRSPTADLDDPGTDQISIPVIFTAIPLDDSESDLPGVSPLTCGMGMGLHNLAFNDLSWLNSTMSSSYWNPLIPQSGITLDRSLNTLPRNLTPTLQSRMGEGPAPATWMNQNHDPIPFQPDPAVPGTRFFTTEELMSIEGLVHQYNANPASLSAAELQLLREAARIHISGSTPTSPFSSYSAPGEHVRWTNSRRYIVRVNADPNATLDVSQPNAFNEGADAVTNVEEAEFLVVGDQSGRIISVQTADSFAEAGSWAFRNAGTIRWAGRLFLVGGIIYSLYRIGSASPEERTKVIGQEAGGLAGGIGGASLATAGCIAFGIATEGLGLFLCGLAGGVIGGTAGSYIGGAAASYSDSHRDETSDNWAWQMYLHNSQQMGEEVPADAYPAMEFWTGPSIF
jgi:hypothetical protein